MVTKLPVKRKRRPGQDAIFNSRKALEVTRERYTQ
jgi:hypothetical protein